MSAFDTHRESPAGDSSTLESQRLLKAAGQRDLDFESQRLRNRLRARMFGIDAAPISIGRFTVLETVGSGGMGVVYAAYDQQLDRRVAVKLLRSSREEDASVGKGRLLREAQALAKLSHPNVVQIYEVGTFDDRVFLAMEFLSGETLRSWLLDGPHPWRETLEHFVQAGHGLAAAHREGIIHRDFKPANLLLGADGRVRVVDFGLARSAERMRIREPDSSDALDEQAFSVELTQTGEIMGTPAYMSPEQARHDEVDARSDQYSFCASLYEGLFGRRPHAGRGTAEVLLAVAEGAVTPPPRGTKVPARIVRAVMRGLSMNPAHRFSSMEELLSELAEKRSWRLRVVGGGVVVAAGLGMMLLNGETPCQGLNGALGAAWSEARAAEVEAAFSASGVPAAPDMFVGIRRGLDSYADAWNVARNDACQAHEVRREQSAEMHDLRVACLLERRAELGALTMAFVDADAQVVRHASHAVLELSPLSSCDDANQVRTNSTLDPYKQQMRVELAEARAEYKAGRYGPSLEKVAHVARRASEAGAADLEAAALLHEGIIRARSHVYDSATDAFERAVDLAEEAGDDEVAAQAWIELVRQLAFSRQAELAERSLRRATAKVQRIGNPPGLSLDLLAASAQVVRLTVSMDAAIEQQGEVVDGYREYLGAGHPKTSDAVRRLANMLGDDGRHEQAQRRYAEARDSLVQVHGKGHPMEADVVVDMAIDLRAAGQLESSRERFIEAEEMVLESLGEQAPALVKINKVLASIAVKQGMGDEARRRAKRAFAMAQSVGKGGDQLDVLAIMATLAQQDDDLELAAGHFGEYLRLIDAGGVDPRYGILALYTRLALADIELDMGRYAKGGALVEEFFVAFEAHADEQLYGLAAEGWRLRGRIAAHDNRTDDGIAAYERALSKLHIDDASPPDDRIEQARIQWGLGQLLFAREPDRARAMVVQARDARVQLEPDASELPEINEWLADVGPSDGA